MAATLVGEAAIRIVPSLRGFKTQADVQLRKTKLEPVKVQLHAETREATAQMDEWRAKQDLKPVVVPVKANSKQFERDIKQIEHRVRESPLHQLTTFNIKILGLDALPALAYAAASAAAGLDALGESVLALPGLLAGVGASVGALALGVDGMKDAFTAFGQEQKTTSQMAHTLADDNRTLQRSYRDYRDAVRDTTREIQDLNAENRRSSLNIADAQLSVQEAADRLRQGNFSTVTELRRAQLSYAESIDHLNDVMTKSNRTQEDANRANAQGVTGSDRVQSALDGINRSLEKLDNDKVGNLGRALAKLAPNAQAAMRAVFALRGEFTQLQHQVQNNLFAGMDKDITNLATRLLPTLQVGLSRVATGLNTNLHAAFGALSSDQSKGFLSRIFANDDVMLQNLSAHGVKPLIDGVMRLMTVSSDFLPRLGNAAATVFARFDNWTEKISNDGSLKQWIHQGMQAMDDLGRIGTGIIGVIHKIGQAFDDVSGHQGGFLKTFADEMAKVNEHLGSSSGMAKLEGYLRGARGEFEAIRGAWDQMKPTVKELIGYAREWSQQTLGLLGTALNLASAFDRVTHALGPLMQYILVMKTLKQGIGIGRDLINVGNAPIRGAQQAKAWWDRLGDSQAKTAAGAATAAAATTAAIEETEAAAARADATVTQSTMTAKQAREEALRYGSAIDKNGNSYDAFGQVVAKQIPEVDKSTLSAKQAREEARRFGEATDKAGNRYNAFGEIVGRVNPTVAASGSVSEAAGNKIAEAGKEAEESGEKIGGAGAGSMMSKVKGLAGALGGGLAGLGLQAAIIVAITAINDLGQAHHQAALMAEQQRQALDDLANSMDRVSGAAGKAAQNQANSQFQKFNFNGNSRNVYDDAKQFGYSPQQIMAAALPQNQGQRNDMLGKMDATNQAKIESSDEWKRTGPIWMKYGIDAHTLALAAGGDEDALKHVTEVYDRMQSDQGIYSWMPEWMKTPMQAAQVSSGKLPESLDSLTRGLGVESFSVPAAIRDQSNAMVRGGQAARQANQATNGKARLKGPAIAWWGGLGGLNDDQHVSVGDDGNAVIITDRDPHVGSDIGTTVKNSNGQYQTTLTTDATKAYVDVQGFSQGGLVRGPGGPTDDAILAKLSDTEHVTQAKAVNYYGVSAFDALNSMSVPRDVVSGWLANVPHRWSGGFGGPKPMSPPIKPPAPAPGGPQVVAAPPSPSQWHVSGPTSPAAAPPPYPAPPPIGAPVPGAPGASQPDLSAGLGEAPPMSSPGVPGMPGAMGPSLLDGVSMGGNGALPDTYGRRGSFASHVDNAPVIPQANILQYLVNVARDSGLRAGSGPSDLHPDIAAALGIPTHGAPDGAQHDFNRALDIGSGEQAKDGQISAFVKQWMSDPTKVASTRQLIFRGPDGDYGIINGRVLTGNELEQVYGDDLGNHTDHVHLALEGVPVDAAGPDGLGMGIPGMDDMGGTGFPGMGGMMPGGVPGQLMDPSSTPMSNMAFRLQNLFNPQNMMANIQGHYAQAYSPKNIMQFLGGQAQSAGQDILGIFTQFVGGLTGINLSSLTGYASQAGNYGMSMIQAPHGGTPGMTDMDSAAGMNMSNFMGAGGLNVGAYGSTGAMSGTTGGGGEQYRPLIRQVLQQWGPRFGIPPSAYSQWEDALVKQINTESGGNSSITSGQGDHGLLQFKPGTFEQFNLIPGASINDPGAQLVAALNRLTHGGPNAYQMNSDGTPQQIGQGGGWASGGFPGSGHAFISNGEYLSNSNATKYYGAAAYNALNGMAVPRSAIRGFLDGGWPIQPPQPPQSRPSMPDIPNVNQMDPKASAGQAAQQAVGAIGGALAGAASGSGGGSNGSGGQSKGPLTAPTTRMGPRPQTPPAVPPAPGTAGGLGGPGGVVKSDGATKKDNRGAVARVGAPPKTTEHLNPALKQGVEGAFNQVGSLAASAASMAGSAFGPAGGAAGGMAGSLMQGATQIAGQAASDALNVLAGFAVQNQGPANGTPLLPQRHSTSMAPPVAQKIHNGDVHVSNMEEYKRAQETMEAQQAMPFIGKYW